MYKRKTFLGVIPARKGSKRLIGKNMLKIKGEPLIFWTIQAAKDSKYLDNIVVSSDDNLIINFSKSKGIETPFIRPKEISNDDSTMYDVLKHTINFYKKEYKKEFDYIVLLQPTSPLRNKNHIDEAISMIDKKKADSIISVSECIHSPLWTGILPKDGNMVNFLKEDIKNKRSQDLEKYYQLNGSIFISNIKRYLVEKTFFLKSNIFSYIMEEKYSIDIDNKIDFELARILLSKSEKRL